MKHLFGRGTFFLTLAVASVTPGFAVGLSFTCDPSVNADSYAGTCNFLNTTIAGLYNSTFTNANASIYIRTQNNNGLANSTVGFFNLEPYSTYQTALQGESTDAAKAFVPVSEPGIYGERQIEITSALAAALGITSSNGNGPNSIVGTTAAGNACFTPGSGGCYNGIITMNDAADLNAQTGGQGYSYRTLGGSTTGTTSNYDYFSVVEHEVDEVLGSSSCIGTGGAGHTLTNGGNCASATDLFRYTSAGNRTFNTIGAAAYFSANGGTTDYQGNLYNNQANGSDWADFSQSCVFVQDASGCLNQSFDITTDGPGSVAGPEVAILNAIGYNLTSPTVTPEPGTMSLFAAGLVGLSAFARRRRKA